jgi:hypothetical protein
MVMSDMEQHEVQTAVDRIESALRGLEFGTVTVVVHHGRVVQVERTEKVRFEKPQQLR